MSEIQYIGPEELIYNSDVDNNIYSGGFSVKSIMMKNGFSPIMTFNNNPQMGGSNVSDLFNDLVVPNWALSYNNRIIGGKYNEVEHKNENEEYIDDDLHDKLLALVEEHEITKNKKNIKKKRETRKLRVNKNHTKKRR
jgi:hypothetical protein